MGIGLGALRRLLDSRRVRWAAASSTALTVLLASAVAFAMTAGDGRTNRPAATARVDRGEVTLAVATVGSLQPAQTRGLGFGTAGTVSEVSVRPGDRVRSGQVLARIDDAEAKAQVDAARSALDQAVDDRNAAERNQAGAPAGACGTAGGGAGGAATQATAATQTPAALAALAASPAPATRTASAAARSGTPNAAGPTRPTGPTDRSSPSVSAGPSVPAGRPSASASRSTPSMPSDRSGGGGASCASGTGKPSTTGNDPILAAVQRVTSAQLALATATDALAGTRITAPIGGTVLSVAGTVGAAVGGGATFVTLADVSGMAVSASFPEADAGRLATGLPATVTLADRPGEVFAARVTQVDPVGTMDGQLVRYGVLLDFDQAPANALVGQSAAVRVTVRSVPDALRVPATAVHAGAGEASGAAVAGAAVAGSAVAGSAQAGNAVAGSAGGSGTVLVRTASGGEPRPVEIGLRGDRYCEIRAGLVEGDEVVVNW